MVQVALLQRARLVPRQASEALDVVGDALGDVSAEAGVQRIERVVEVEQPGVDVAEIGAHGVPPIVAHRRWRAWFATLPPASGVKSHRSSPRGVRGDVTSLTP